MRKGDGPDLLCAGFFEDAGGLLERSTRGFYVINKDDGFAANRLRVADRKDIFDIFAAIGCGKFRLRCCRNGADKRVRVNCHGHIAGNVLGEK